MDDKMADYKYSEQLSASVIMSSEVVFDLYCEFCSEEGKHVEADGFCVDCSDYLCRECFKVHKKTRASRKHQLQDKTTMPKEKQHQSQKVSSSITQAPQDTLTESCELHPEETIKFYCRDHRVLGCSVCMTVGHRACEGMEYIRDITPDLLASQEYKSFEKELTAVNAKSQDIIKISRENISKAETCCEEANITFHQQRNDMIKAFDQLAKDVKNQPEKLKNVDVKNMKAIWEKGKYVVNEIENIKSNINKLEENDQLCQLFITMKRVNGKLDTFREVLQLAEEENFVTTYKFEPGAVIRQIIKSPAALGSITIEAPPAETAQGATAKEAFPVVPGNNMTHIQPAQQATTAAHQREIIVKTATDRKTARKAYPAVPAVTRSHIKPAPQATAATHQRDITVKTASDSTTCYITGCVLLPNNSLVLTDWNNNKVKLIDLQNAIVTTEMNTNLPWDITIITADQVAVTVHQEIVFVKVNETLSIERKMKVNGQCRGIVYGASKLFVTFIDPGKIEILTLDGVLEKKIDRDSRGEQMFDWPLYIALSSNCTTFYVSDINNDSIKRIALDGSVLAVYKDNEMNGPGNLVVDQFGRVIFCGEYSNNIHLLKLDDNKAEVLLSDLSRPESLCYSQQTGLLYVGQNIDTVKVYQLPYKSVRNCLIC